MKYWLVCVLFVLVSCRGVGEFFQSSEFEPAAGALKNAGEEAAQGDFIGALLAVATAGLLGGGGYIKWKKKKARASSSTGNS